MTTTLKPKTERSHRSVPLLPVLNHGERDPLSVEHRLADAARSAQAGDAQARNGLYFAFEPRLHRIARTIWRRHGCAAGIDWEEMQQESFLVFVDVLESWDGLRPVIPYVLGVFPWRMRDAVDRLGDVPPRAVGFRPSLALFAADNYLDEEALRLLEALAIDLPFWHQRVLLLRIRDGQTEREIARALGFSRRTIQRIAREAREMIATALEGENANRS